MRNAFIRRKTTAAVIRNAFFSFPLSLPARAKACLALGIGAALAGVPVIQTQQRYDSVAQLLTRQSLVDQVQDKFQIHRRVSVSLQTSLL